MLLNRSHIRSVPLSPLLSGPSQADLTIFVACVEQCVALKTLEYFRDLLNPGAWRLSETLLLMLFEVRQQEAEPCTPQGWVVGFAFSKVCSLLLSLSSNYSPLTGPSGADAEVRRRKWAEAGLGATTIARGLMQLPLEAIYLYQQPLHFLLVLPVSYCIGCSSSFNPLG